MIRPILKNHSHSGHNIQQYRSLKRRLAYPQTYKPQTVPLSHPKKDHSSFFQRHLKAWLGPVNARGEYFRNKYYYPPQNHKPKYIVPDGNTVVADGQPEVQENRRFSNNQRDPSLQPFPSNPYCKTAYIISDELKQRIMDDVNNNGLHVQEVAHKYGIKIARVEAIVKLGKIEKQWQENVSIAFSI